MIKEYLSRSLDILITPFIKTDILWIVLPLLLILVMIHLYFGRNRSEELGWNSAFSNSISLIWISVILMRTLYQKNGMDIISDPSSSKSLILVGIFASITLILMFFNFFHILPKRLAFTISSSESMYITAFIIISVILGDFPLDMHTLVSSIIVFIVLVILFKSIKCLVPLSRNAEQTIKKREKKEHRKKAGRKAARTKKLRKTVKKIKKKLL